MSQGCQPTFEWYSRVHNIQIQLIDFQQDTIYIIHSICEFFYHITRISSPGYVKDPHKCSSAGDLKEPLAQEEHQTEIQPVKCQK